MVRSETLDVAAVDIVAIGLDMALAAAAVAGIAVVVMVFEVVAAAAAKLADVDTDVLFPPETGDEETSPLGMGGPLFDWENLCSLCIRVVSRKDVFSSSPVVTCSNRREF